MKNIKELCFGYIIGIANIIPGVSGGTFALILGILERLMKIINSISPAKLRELWQGGKTGSIKKRLSFFHVFCKNNDYYFLLRIIGGALFASVTLAGVMTYLLNNYFSATYGLFFGMILVSILIPLQLIKRFRWRHIAMGLAGIALVVMVGTAGAPVKKAEQRSELYKVELQKNSANSSSSFLVYNGTYSAGELGYIFLAGVIAISAMILPGLSGSLILLVMGRYSIILAAVYSVFKFRFTLDELILLTIFLLGLVIGILLFARVLEYIFQRWHDDTTALLTGLVAGSLYALWPFKTAVVLNNIYWKNAGKIDLLAKKTVYTNTNCLPGTENWQLPLLTFLVGCIIMTFFLKKDTEKA